MTDLTASIRARLSSGRQLSTYDIDQILRVAQESEGGVQVGELQQLVAALEQTPEGFSPRMRALLAVRLSGFGASEALSALEQRPVRYTEAQKLEETRARFEFLLESAREKLNSISWIEYRVSNVTDEAARAEGRLEPAAGANRAEFDAMLRELKETQTGAVRAMKALRKMVAETSKSDLEISLASMSSWTRDNIGSIGGRELPDWATSGMSPADIQELKRTIALPALKHDGLGSNAFAGVVFASDVDWTFESDSNLLRVPKGTEITKLPLGGEFRIVGEDLRLPGGIVFERGSFYAKDGAPVMNSGSVASADGMPITTRSSGAQIRRASNGLITAGPSIDIVLPLMNAEGRRVDANGELVEAEREAIAAEAERAAAAEDARKRAEAEAPSGGWGEGEGWPMTQPARPTAPANEPPPARDLEQRSVRLAVQEATIPGAADIRQGNARFTALYEKGRAIGVLHGSTTVESGALVYQRMAGNGSNKLVDRAGERGELRSGSAVFKDGQLVGLGQHSTATIDGLTLRSGGESNGELATYKFERPGTFKLGKGITVEELPKEGTLDVRGESVTVVFGDQRAEIVSGGVRVENGVVVAVLPGSTVRFQHGSVVTKDATVRLLTAAPTTFPSGNSVFLGADAIAASGKDFSVKGVETSKLLPAGLDRVFGDRPIRAGIELAGGSFRMKPAHFDGRPKGIELVDVRGDITVQSGALSFNTARPQQPRVEALGSGGPMVWLNVGGQRYELDTRPMWSTFDPATDAGRVYARPKIVNTGRFAHQTTARETERVLAGQQVLKVGATPESARPLVREIQQTLSYYLDRAVAWTGTYDQATADAVKAFQRLNQLEPTGEVNAATLQRLDEASPAANRPTVTAQVGRFGGAVATAVDKILKGQLTLKDRSNDPRRKITPDTGELVQRVQQTLAERGFTTGTDGIFGPGTGSAVAQFQRAEGLAATGAIDAATMRKLLELYPLTTETRIQPRKHVMVMMSMNNEVPSEYPAFRELAASRGAEAIVIGPPAPEGHFQDPQTLQRFFARVEAGELQMDWLVVSGHSTGNSTWGGNGRFEYSWLQQWKEVYPRAFAEMEKLTLLNCYNVTPEKARGFWPQVFPNLNAAAGFMYSAPGKETRQSPNFMLNSAQVMLTLPKGEVPEPEHASRIAKLFQQDGIIRHQNAALWVRNPAEPSGTHAMTITAQREAEKKGVQESLRSIDPVYVQAFDNFLKAETDEFAEPPTGHSSVLRDYLGAVQHVLDGFEARVTRYRQWQARQEREMRAHRERQAQDASYVIPESQTPEEFAYAYNWDRQFEEANQLRQRILSLIKHKDIRRQFGELYARPIAAFNAWMRTAYAAAKKEGDPAEPALMPTLSELQQMKRKDVLTRLKAVRESINKIPTSESDRYQQGQDWSIMSAKDPSQRSQVSPLDFVRRADEFLNELSPRVIQPEWLDDTLLARDVAALR